MITQELADKLARHVDVKTMTIVVPQDLFDEYVTAMNPIPKGQDKPIMFRGTPVVVRTSEVVA